MTTDPAGPAEPAPAAGVGRGRETVEVYDFRRPTKLSREHVRGLQLICETFAHQWSTQLAALLRSAGQVEPAGVSQHPYGELVNSLSSPSVLAMMTAEGVEGTFMLHLDLPLAMSWIDRVLGGEGTGEQPTRAPTPLELSLLRFLLDKVAGELPYAFAPMAEVVPTLGAIETNPQFAQTAGATDTMIVATFSVGPTDQRHEARLVLPFDAFAPLLLPPESEAPASARAERTGLERSLGTVPLDVSAQLAPALLDARDVLALAPGDLLPLPHPVSQPLTLVAEGRAVAHAVAGASGSRLACLVVDPGRDRA